MAREQELLDARVAIIRALGRALRSGARTAPKSRD